MTHARIFQKSKNAMQSGRAGTHIWRLEFEAGEAKRADPLMGWAGSGDTRNQLGLSFATLDAAKAYADLNGISFHVVTPPVNMLKLQTYADNFR
ncbi:MAG: ETC complex I subunit [Chakrabartia sp.]